MSMRRLGFNFKDRKLLFGVLTIVIVSIFTLSIAYAALNTVLNISGNAEVASSTWNVHFDNLTNISDYDAPVITSPTSITFNPVLNMPGDKYIFTIDVVNDGSIDAIIDSIEKKPELTAEQAKYINYVIEYVNGDSISTKQVVGAGDFVRIRVYVEYRKDINASDLPTSQTILNLSIKLNYSQRDEEGSVVVSHGIPNYTVINTEENLVGSELCLSGECFYLLAGVEETDDYTDVLLLSKYNLFVGNEVSSFNGDYVNPIYTAKSLVSPTGIQDARALGINGEIKNDTYNYKYPFYGTVPFSTSKHWESSPTYDDLVNNNYYLLKILSDYAKYVTSLGFEVVNFGIPNTDLLTSLGCTMESCPYEWLSNTSYWVATVYSDSYLFTINKEAGVSFAKYDTDYLYGIRPWIIYRSYK